MAKNGQKKIEYRLKNPWGNPILIQFSIKNKGKLSIGVK